MNVEKETNILNHHQQIKLIQLTLYLPLVNNVKMIADTPKPPYYAVIFSNIRTKVEEGYAETAVEMVRLAEAQEGYLGYESVRDGLGITVSYWTNLDSIRNWKQQTDHLLAQRMGREKWYSAYKTRICLVERDYGFEI